MEHVIGYFCAEMRRMLNSDRVANWDYYGQCGLAQCAFYHAFHDASIPFVPFSNHNLKNVRFKHVAGTVGHLGNLYLVDPTYVQFETDRGEGVPPFKLLSATAEGKRVAEDLKTKGFMRVTPKSAQLYINSFTGVEDNMPIAEDISYAWLINPPPCEQNFLYGSDNDKGTLENLIRDGVYLKTRYTYSLSTTTLPSLML